MRDYFLIAAVSLFFACSCAQNEPSSVIDGDSASCSRQRDEIHSALSRINFCSSDSDCRLTQDNSAFGFCKRFGYNSTQSLAPLQSLLDHYSSSCHPNALNCTADFAITAQPCMAGRCVSNVDAYSLP